MNDGSEPDRAARGLRATRRQPLVAAAAALALAACAELELRPAAPTAAGTSAAAAQQDGVRVTVRTEDWAAHPSDLDSVLTPVFVRVENGGARDLRLRYEDFRLVTDAGGEFTALPPREIRATVTRPVGAAYRRYTDRQPSIESRTWRHFPDSPMVADPLHREGPLYDTRDPRAPFNPFVEVALPTRDMLESAFPDGVLAAGATASGFLYFRKIQQAGPVTFKMENRGGPVQIALVAR